MMWAPFGVVLVAWLYQVWQRALLRTSLKRLLATVAHASNGRSIRSGPDYGAATGYNKSGKEYVVQVYTVDTGVIEVLHEWRGKP
jgi:hypothetical protein